MTALDLRKATLSDLPVIKYNDGTTSIDAPATNDALDRLLTRLDMKADPLLLVDPRTGGPMRLTPAEAALIERLQSGLTGDEDFDPFQPYVDFFTQDRLSGPLVNRTEPKRRFMASKWETQRIRKLVYSIRKGYIKTGDVLQPEAVPYYDIWAKSDPEAEERARRRVHVPAPKPPLPGHAESYNPPEEYLPNEEEVAAWEALPEDQRQTAPLSKKYKSLRLLPLYDRLIQERFSRCLDLYLCPRVVKNKIMIDDPDSLLPQLPSPDTLKPYPSVKSTEYIGHAAERITSMEVHASGQWLASSAGTQVRVWDCLTGRCVEVFDFDAPVRQVSWCPRREVSVLAVATGRTLRLLVAAADAGSADTARSLFTGPGAGTLASLLKWRPVSKDSVAIEHEHDIDVIAWHERGDYVACMMRCAPHLAASIVMHQLSRRTSQQPFGRLPAGQPRHIAFAPAKPYFVLATAQHVRIYDMVSQRLVKKLAPGRPEISAVACHPASPDNVVAAAGERLFWFDCDLGVAPYRSFHTHVATISAVGFHRTHPLFASASNDGTIQLFHGRVYDELDKTPLIVPVKVLRVAAAEERRQVSSLAFHPTQPLLYSGDCHGTISVFV